MTEKKPTFPKKWQAVLYECLRMSRSRWWEPWSKREAWGWIDKGFLKRHGIKKYSSFEHHIRRLHAWDYLYCYPGEGFLPHRYLISRAGLNKLQKLGAISEKEAQGAKWRLRMERED